MPGLFERRGVPREARRALFFGVCVWVRLLAAVMLPRAAARAAAAVAAAVIARALLQSSGQVWWSRGFHLATAVCVAAGLPHTPLMVADVLVGVLHAWLSSRP